MKKLIDKISNNYCKRKMVWKIKHIVYMCIVGVILATIVGVVLAKFL